MAGAVQLAHGDMLSGPADLVVIPCSTGGTVTPFVRERMHRFDLPDVPAMIPFGEVRILPLLAAGSVAHFVAYAASVAGSLSQRGSQPAAIRTIGQQLGAATRDGSIQRIHCPLLGTGAGGLSGETTLDELTTGFLEEASEGAVLRIFVLDPHVYEGLARRTAPGRASEPANPEVPPAPRPQQAEAVTVGEVPPRVLISYTGSSETNKEWVDSLFRFLRSHGVNARLDSYFLRAGMDFVQWMCNELTLADKVILVCDEHYRDRADGRHGGVGWETMIVQGQMYAESLHIGGEDAPSRYIPVVRCGRLQDGLPAYLTTKRVLHLPPTRDDESCCREILDEIFVSEPDVPPVTGSPVIR